MKCKRISWAAAFAVAVSLATSLAQADVVTLQDFEGPLPGLQSYPDGYSFAGGGVGDPNVIEQITDQVAYSGLQSFQIDLDASINDGSYFYYGLGGFLGFFGDGFGAAGGQAGADNPSRFAMSFDIMVQGNDGDEAATPVGGLVGLHKGDYEAVYGVDLNDDGDMDDGYDIWQSEFVVPIGDPNWTHNVWQLDSGTTPTAPSPEIDTPFFDDESTFFFQIYFNSGGFGTDANNVVNLDNVQLEFTPAGPGDFNGDSYVDGRDFLEWQLGNSPDPLSAADLTEWKSNYPTSPLSAVMSAVPEPSTMMLSLIVSFMALVRRR